MEPLGESLAGHLRLQAARIGAAGVAPAESTG
jgi:hypothetical protein